MRGTTIFLISLMTLVLGNVELNNNKCPKDITVEKLMPHENCNRFYHCVMGNLVVRKCASTLQFNVETQQCDWPEQVDCGDRYIDNNDSEEPIDAGEKEDDENTTVNDKPELASIICAKKGSDGFLIAHEYCNRFYKCYNGLPVPLRCPVNLLYNPRKEQCDWPDNVNCGDRLIPDGDSEDVGSAGGGDNDNSGSDGNNSDTSDGNNNVGNDDPSEASTICAAKESDGILIAHEYCNRFYKCYNGLPVPLRCPVNLLYNPRKEQCDWPDNVNCGDRLIPDSDSEDVGSDNSGASGGDNDNSGADGNNNVGNDDPSEAPAICAAKESDGILIAHEYCNRFYKCYNGLPVPLRCPVNLLYNPRKEQCDWPDNVVCGNRLIPDADSEDVGSDSSGAGGENNDNSGADGNNSDNSNGGNDDPSEASSICAAKESDGMLIAHEYCNRFYKCYNGLPVPLRCPVNLLYNPRKEQCDWPDNVNCGDRLIPDSDSEDVGSDNSGASGGDNDNSGADGNNNVGNDDPSEAPAICAAKESDGILIAHEYCNRFYKCYNGLPVPLRCPVDLLYNPRKEQCDWPDNVVCGNRLIPDGDSEDVGSDNNDAGSGDNDNSGSDGNNDDNNLNGGNNVVNNNPSEAPAICAEEGSDGILIAHEYCNKFYKCSRGLPVDLRCPFNLFFNPSTEQCDWPLNVKCGNRIINGEESSDNDDNLNNDDNESADIEVSTICDADDSDGIYTPHKNCNQFYVCSDRKAVVLTCPSNLLYDVDKTICDWSFNVDCKDRILPIL